MNEGFFENSSKSVRLVARLDVKGEHLIKGLSFEGLRVVGSPQDRALKYYLDGADELLYIDHVASLYSRSSISHLVAKATEQVFVPITVGGGVRTVEDAQELLRSGADKIAINSAAVRDPSLLSRISEKFGSQCVVLSIEAKKQPGNTWEVLVDAGRQKSGIDALDWAARAISLGVGEILVTSVDKDGRRGGPDFDLVKEICSMSTVPVIASGGIGTLSHAVELLQHADADAIAIGAAVHRDDFSFLDLREELLQNGVGVRRYGSN